MPAARKKTTRKRKSSTTSTSTTRKRKTSRKYNYRRTAQHLDGGRKANKDDYTPEHRAYARTAKMSYRGAKKWIGKQATPAMWESFRKSHQAATRAGKAAGRKSAPARRKKAAAGFRRTFR